MEFLILVKIRVSINRHISRIAIISKSVSKDILDNRWIKIPADNLNTIYTRENMTFLETSSNLLITLESEREREREIRFNC